MPSPYGGPVLTGYVYTGFDAAPVPGTDPRAPAAAYDPIDSGAYFQPVTAYQHTRFQPPGKPVSKESEAATMISDNGEKKYRWVAADGRGTWRNKPYPVIAHGTNMDLVRRQKEAEESQKKQAEEAKAKHARDQQAESSKRKPKQSKAKRQASANAKQSEQAKGSNTKQSEQAKGSNDKRDEDVNQHQQKDVKTPAGEEEDPEEIERRKKNNSRKKEKASSTRVALPRQTCRVNANSRIAASEATELESQLQCRCSRAQLGIDRWCFRRQRCSVHSWI